MGVETFAYYAAENLIFLEKSKEIMYGAPRFLTDGHHERSGVSKSPAGTDGAAISGG